MKVLDFGLAKLTEAGERSERRPRPRRMAVADRRGHDRRHGRLHVAGAGGREAGGRALGHLQLRLGAVRDGDGAAGRSRASRRCPRWRRSCSRSRSRPATRRAIPQELEKLISRCLRKDPARRFQHMDDVKVALEELKEESESGQLARATSPGRTRFAAVGLGRCGAPRSCCCGRTAGLAAPGSARRPATSRPRSADRLCGRRDGTVVLAGRRPRWPSPGTVNGRTTTTSTSSRSARRGLPMRLTASSIARN